MTQTFGEANGGVHTGGVYTGGVYTGGVRFKVYMPDASDVKLVGSFTSWRDGAVAMTKDPAGWWHAELDLGAGDHEFQYLVDDSHWLADYAAGGLRLNRFGTWVSQLHIAAPDAPSYSFEDLARDMPQRMAA
ncbi:MAG: glycogen-binding domain-containing protein [Phycisphaerales bacterium]